MTRRPALAACAVAALAAAVYANTLGHDLVYDDVRVIVDNPAVRVATDWRRILTTPSWSMEGRSTNTFRPLATWTFALDHALHGREPFGYHLVNVVLHALASALLVLLVASTGAATLVALVAGAFFAVHPIHTEVVANGVGRAELLAATFALLALLLARRRGTGARVAALGSYALALLSKEHAIALCVLLPLADLLLDDGGSMRRFVRRLPGTRGVFYGALLGITLAYLALRAVVLGGPVGALDVEGRVALVLNPVATAPPGLRILTALAVQAWAAWLLLWPVSLSADYSWAEIPVVAGPADPRAIVGVLAAVVLVAGLGLAWRRHRQTCLWLGLAVVPWIPVSNLLIPIGTIFGERLLYLPSAGICALLALGVGAASRRLGTAAAGTLAAALIVAWSGLTLARNPVWASDLTLARSIIQDAPRSAHAHDYLGRVYAGLGRDDEALAELEVAVRLLAPHPTWPTRLDALYRMAQIHDRRGEAARARPLYEEIVARDPSYFPAWVNLGALANRLGDHAQALQAAERAAAIRPGMPNAMIVRGFALRGLGRRHEAVAAFETVLARVPNATDAQLGLAAATFELGEYARAADAFASLVATAPSRDAYVGLVLSLERAGRVQEAQRVAADARRRFPNDAAFGSDAAAQRARLPPPRSADR